jgi:uncharacterized heparinase superfamily protein
MQRGALLRLFQPAALFAGSLGLPMAKPCRISGLKTPIAHLVKGSPETARALYRGTFAFAGAAVEAGSRSIFDAQPPNLRWAQALHGFEWLFHLAAQNAVLDRVFARSLVSEWAERRPPPVGRDPQVAARRMINTLKFLPFLLEGSHPGFEASLHGLIERDAARLSAPSRGAADLMPALALALAASGLRGADPLEAPALARLERAIEHCVLPDGGHISRSPAEHLALLLDLLPLRIAMGARRAAIPQPINAAIERMIPMLRFFSLGDGGLAMFQGTGQPMVAEAKAALDQDTSFGRPFAIARYTRYARLAHGRVALVMDCGDAIRHDSPLAFEMSDGVHRLVVNCGSPAETGTAWARGASSAAAHSTVAFDGGSASAVGECEANASEAGSMAGARRAIGPLLHGRDIFLSADGGDLRGEDSFAHAGAPQRRLFAIRFHLHPSVKATLAKGSGHVMLQLPDKAGWRFSVRGAGLALEESVYLGSASGVRKSEQIVLRGDAASTAKVNWAFRRIEKREKSGAPKSDNPRLPF